jgi:hypothetical protein
LDKDNFSITSSMAEINFNQNLENIQKQMEEMTKDAEQNEKKFIEIVKISKFLFFSP